MMKIATFLLTDNEVAPFANNAKFIELTEVYDAVCAASNIEEEARRDGDDALAILELIKNPKPLSEVAKAHMASEGELIKFLAHSVFECRERRQRAEAKLDDDNASKEDIDTAKNDLTDDSDIYDYDTIDLQFTTIENYEHRSKLRRTSNYFRNALEAYCKIKIFDFSEDDTRYDVSLAIINIINLDFQY
ncbi:hypothetical protein N9V66_05045 [Amylibacter sp.]|nr:hypothetical protein [Amylibacter sp.]